MPAFASLLRGVNVGGNRKIPMAELKALYEESGLTNVKTYIQSGNVVFQTSHENPDDLRKLIESKVEARFGFDVTVLIRTAEELQRVLESNPFETADEVYVTFLAEEPSPEKWAQLKALDLGSERSELRNKEIFLQFPDGYGKAKMSNLFVESKLNVRATTRNWRTINEIINLF